MYRLWKRWQAVHWLQKCLVPVISPQGVKGSQLNTPSLSDLATVAIIPRDSFSMTSRVVERVVDSTKGHLDLIVVDSCMPKDVRDRLEQQRRKAGFTVLRADKYATPNQMRNAVLPHVTTKYVVYVDNDVLVTKGWLEALVKCAEETSAWIVGPLTCERLPEATYVHGYDGELEIRQPDQTCRVYHDFHFNAHLPLQDIRHLLVRKETPVVEFHAMLMAMEAVRSLGALDEELANMYEYSDLCLRVREAGRLVMLEPASVVTYLPPTRLAWEDRYFFELRWGEAWTEMSKKRLSQKYGVTFNHPEAKCPHNFVRSMRMLGKPWLKKPRKFLGRDRLRKIERKWLVHIDAALNRIRYPSGKFGKIEPVKFEVIR
jgi:GT2 family glycosyltransferase